MRPRRPARLRAQRSQPTRATNQPKPPNRIERAAIFAREQEHMARLQAQGAAAESALDLASYVEFNKAFK